MNQYSVYNLQTGLFTGVKLSGSSENLESNVPEGCSVLLGEYDYKTKKVDLETNEVVEFIPDKPSEDAQWSDIEKRWVTSEEAGFNVKNTRMLLLTNCDWVVSRASETGQPVPAEWATYRQALRDITTQTGFPFDINWPTPPSAN